MTIVQVAPVLAALGFLAFAIPLALSANRRMWPAGESAWMIPAALCVAFTLWTIYALIAQGLTAVWWEISRSPWSNQIFIDLLLAGGIGLLFVVPEAKRLGMRPLPWALAVAATGCIALLAMLSRVLYLRARQPAPST